MVAAPPRENLATYLLRIGFQGPVAVTRWSDGSARGELFVREGYAVEVPFGDQAADFGSRVQDWARAVARAEEKPVERILSDVVSVATDVVRVTLASSESGIGLQRATQALGGVAGLLVAAAGDVAGHRVRHFAAHSGVREFLGRTELGHTEVGSYVFPVKVRLGPTEAVELPIPTSETRIAPQWRKPVVRMRELLELADRVAAEVARADGRIEVADDAVADGLSINLCRGLLRTRMAAEQAVRFEWSFALAYEWPAWRSKTLVSQRRHLDVLEAISRHLEASQPEPDYVLQGRVVRLDRGPEAQHGTIGIVEPGERRPVRVRLYGRDYMDALEAHKLRRDLRVTGTLVGRKLEGPRDVSVEDPLAPLLDLAADASAHPGDADDVD